MLLLAWHACAYHQVKRILGVKGHTAAANKPTAKDSTASGMLMSTRAPVLLCARISDSDFSAPGSTVDYTQLAYVVPPAHIVNNSMAVIDSDREQLLPQCTQLTPYQSAGEDDNVINMGPLYTEHPRLRVAPCAHRAAVSHACAALQHSRCAALTPVMPSVVRACVPVRLPRQGFSSLFSTSDKAAKFVIDNQHGIKLYPVSQRVPRSSTPAAAAPAARKA